MQNVSLKIATQICYRNKTKFARNSERLNGGEKMALFCGNEDFVLTMVSKKKKRRFCVHLLLQSRDGEEMFHHLTQEMKLYYSHLCRWGEYIKFCLSNNTWWHRDTDNEYVIAVGRLMWHAFVTTIMMGWCCCSKCESLKMDLNLIKKKEKKIPNRQLEKYFSNASAV